MKIDELDQQIIDLVQDTTKKMRKIKAKSIKKWKLPELPELTLSQIQTLAFIRRLEPVTMSRLAEELSITGASASEHVNALENAGLVERKTEEADRRSLTVHLSPKGTQAFQSLMEMRYTNLGTLMSALNKEDKQELLRLLTKINNSLSSSEAS